MDSVTPNYPVKLRDGLRANLDGVIATRTRTEIETGEDLFTVREILVETWIGAEGRRYRRALTMKVRRKAF